MTAVERHPSTGFAEDAGTVRATQEAKDIVVVSVEGEVDMANSPQIVEEVERALDDRNHLILDLSDATFIDSSVINAILTSHRAASARGQVAVLQLGTAAGVERVIGLSGIEELVPRAHNRADAVRTIHERAAD